MIAIGTAELHRSAHGPDVPGHPGDQVAGAGASRPDPAAAPGSCARCTPARPTSRSCPNTVEVRCPPEREQRLGAPPRRRAATTSGVPPGGGGAVGVGDRLVDQPAEQPRHEQRGARGQRVEEHHQGEQPPPRPHQPHGGSPTPRRSRPPASRGPGCARRRTPSRRRSWRSRCRRRRARAADAGARHPRAGSAPRGISGASRRASRQVSAEVASRSVIVVPHRPDDHVGGRPGSRAAAPRGVPEATARQPAVEEHDPVGVVQPQRRHRGDHRRPAAPVLGHPLGDPRLGVGVHRGGRLDQHQDRRVRRRSRGPAPPAAAGRPTARDHARRARPCQPPGSAS